MKQDIYIYYFKNDTKCEALGRVIATSVDEARELISERKALNVNLISDLFVIKKLENHENIIQLDNN